MGDARGLLSSLVVAAFDLFSLIKPQPLVTIQGPTTSLNSNNFF